MDKKILVTGGSGLVGRALQEIMPDAVYITSKDYDLTNQWSCEALIGKRNWHTVVHLAATVSGVEDNMKRPYDHFTDNMLMNTNMLDMCRRSGVKRFIGMLSTCAYEDVSETYPLTEDMIYNGKPPSFNFSYGFAKRAMGVQIEACNKQYGTKYNYLIPCNLYGRHDKYNENRSHYVGALIRKIYEAKRDGKDHITLFGTGKPLRQFIYANDVAWVIKHFIDRDITENVNISSYERVYSIHEIAEIALKACDAEHLKIVYDAIKPDGQFRKDVSNKKLSDLLPDFMFTNLIWGIRQTYDYYCKNQ